MSQRHRTANSRRNDSTRLAVLRLESRIVPTTNLILDFDGVRIGTDSIPILLRNDQGYTLQTGAEHVSWSGAFFGTDIIRQIVAGVRQDFADFDVNVVWNDFGFEVLAEDNKTVITDPTKIANKDTVIMIVSDANDAFEGNSTIAFGAAPFDTRQLRADMGFVFTGSIFGSQPNPDNSELINQYISAISQQAAYTFGLSPMAVPNPDRRQISYPIVENNGFDTRFSNRPVSHIAPEAGKVYTERDRLFANLGAAKFGTALASNEVLSSQTLLLEAPLLALGNQNIGLFTSTVPTSSGPQLLRLDFAGDQDAFRIVLNKGVTYNIRERGVSAGFQPSLNLYNRDGILFAQDNADGFIAFTPIVTGNYYIVAGSTYDLATGDGTNGGPVSLGTYNLEITPTWLDINTVANTVTIFGEAAANTFNAGLVNGVFTATVVTPATKTTPAITRSFALNGAFAKKLTLQGLGGDDSYTVDLAAGAIDVTIDDNSGAADRLTVFGTNNAETFTIDDGKLIARPAFQPGATIAYNNIETLTLSAFAGNDIVDVLGGPTTMKIDGGAPTFPLLPGDILNLPVDSMQDTVLGTWALPNGQTVFYTEFESFNVPPPPPPTVSAEDRAFATGSGPGTTPLATMYLAGRDAPSFTVLAYNPSYQGGVRVATGDIDGDGTPDLITGTGPGGGSHVKVFSGINPEQIITEFFAYPGFNGGFFVASGDVNGDGRADIITGADAGGGPHVKAFSGVDSSVIFSSFAYFGGFRGGVRVAAGDLDGDGRAEIITGAGAGGGPHVRVLDGISGALVYQYFAFNSAFTGGVYVSSGDLNGDGFDDIAVGAGEGGGPVVAVRDGLTKEPVSLFLAYPTGTTASTAWSSGARVAIADSDADGFAEIFTVPGKGRSSIFRAFIQNGAQVWSQTADPTFLGGSYVG